MQFDDLLLSRLATSGAYDQKSLELAQSLMGDPGWAAVLMIFAFRPIAGRFRPFLDLKRRRVNLLELQSAAESWSSGERALVAISLSLLNGRTKVDLMEVMSTLSGEWADTALQGMLAYQHRVLIGAG